MSEYGAFPEPGTVRFERVLPGPIERVWEYLTDSEKRGKWLAAGEMDLRVGGKVELIFNNNKLTHHNETPPDKYKQYGDETRMYGKVTRCEPPHLLSYTWAEKEFGIDSEVTFELTALGKEVRMVLTHRRLGEDRDTIVGVAAGWHTHVGILIDLLEARALKPFWSTHMKMEAEYEKRL